jgi:hypothetical protein
MFHLHPHVLAMQNPKGICKTREKNCIRHLQVTNAGDVVPLLPIFGFNGCLPILYKHVGMNLILYEGVT